MASSSPSNSNGFFPTNYPSPPSPPFFTNKVMISAIITLFCVIVFVLLLHLYVRWLWWRSPVLRAHAHGARIHRMNFAAVGAAETRGLSKEDIDLLPVFAYQKQEAAEQQQQHDKQKQRSSDGAQEQELSECAVCLCEFEEGEELRLLPRCRHCFHTGCIDMWFYSHSTCPLCRATVVGMRDATDAPLCGATAEAQGSREEGAESSGGDRLEQGSEDGDFVFWRAGGDVRIDVAEASASLRSPAAEMQFSASSSRRQQRFLKAIGTRSMPHIRIDVNNHRIIDINNSASSTPSSSTPTPPPLIIRSPTSAIRISIIRRILSASASTSSTECNAMDPVHDLPQTNPATPTTFKLSSGAGMSPV